MENISEKKLYKAYIDVWHQGEKVGTYVQIIKAISKNEAFEKMLNYQIAYYDLLEKEDIEFKKFKAVIL